MKALPHAWLRWLVLGLLSAVAAASLPGPTHAADEGRTKVRILYDFEDSSDIQKLMKRADGLTLTPAEDVGVTHGSRCARLAARKGADYAALAIADEPRENPNPWNRNLADSIAYGDLLREAGVVSFVTPMGDAESGKDYTVLVDHSDIISTHAWKGSAGLIARTHEKGKTLWLYNTGMDRFSLGFYNWRVRSEGRWEWHFCGPNDAARGGYPGREWCNPFTSVHGFAPYAPPDDYFGGMLFQSKFLDVQEGVTDYAYLFRLNKAIGTAEGDPKKSGAVKEAKAFLAALDRAIPELPGAKGLLNEGDGALVGMGVDDDARLQAPHWRETIARLLMALKS